jgi:signal transduction histidine kinase
MKGERPTGPLPTRRLVIVFVAVISSFVVATALVHGQLRSIDRTALAIADNAAPSIEHLTEARSEIPHVQALLTSELARIGRGEPLDASALDVARHATERAIDAYTTLPVLPNERELWINVFRSRGLFVEALGAFEHAAREGDVAEAAAALDEKVKPAAVALSDALTATIHADAANVAAFAREIRELRARAGSLALALDFACTLIAIGGAVVARRLMRDHAALLEHHERLQEERALELESFAGRVAHDIRSPLGTVAFALSLAATSVDEQRRQRAVGRGTAAVQRITKLVDGLLEFARAGGRPRAGARADVDTAIDDLVLELEPVAADAGTELRSTCDGRHVVGCNAGVLTSLIANLARNAIKYIGDGPVRRVEIRARGVGDAVRVEVEDTGPGLPPDIENDVFEPYVRAQNTSQPGVGLGLATVKRLAEAHGGRVGVASVPGAGATFWFELPRASA